MSVIYIVDPESDNSFGDSDIDSEIEIECVKWYFKSIEYTLDETTNNVYQGDQFIGKRCPGQYQGEYIIDYEAKED